MVTKTAESMKLMQADIGLIEAAAVRRIEHPYNHTSVESG